MFRYHSEKFETIRAIVALSADPTTAALHDRPDARVRPVTGSEGALLDVSPAACMMLRTALSLAAWVARDFDAALVYLHKAGGMFTNMCV